MFITKLYQTLKLLKSILTTEFTKLAQSHFNVVWEVYPIFELLIYIFLSFYIYKVSFNNLTRRTKEGMEIASHLDGLEKLIKATASNKFKINPPKMTPEYHNKILPYAIAFKCDNEWSSFLDNPINKALMESEK